MERARTALSALLPGRAARRVLERAVEAEGLSEDQLDGERMASLLLGRVYHDLRDTLPRATLRRELKRLARSLHDPVAAPAQPAAVPAQPAAVPAAASPGASESARVRFAGDAEDVLMALAVLEGVDGTAVFDDVGRALSTRGEVNEADALGRVIAAGGSLLLRHGELRSLCVTTTGGSLIAVPVPPRWLAVSGAPDMNLGAVYAALTALEEER